MAKINKTSITLPSLAKPCPPEERLRRLCENGDEYDSVPPTEQALHDIAVEMINWADQEDSYIMSDFYNPRGHSVRKIDRWALKYPMIKAALEYAKETIGARRIRKRILESNCDFTLDQYSSEWRQKEDRIHQRKLEIAAKKDQNQPTVVHVIQQKAEDCPEVPPAPKEIVIHANESRDNSKT